jgi:hypothetical protein
METNKRFEVIPYEIIKSAQSKMGNDWVELLSIVVLWLQHKGVRIMKQQLENEFEKFIEQLNEVTPTSEPYYNDFFVFRLFLLDLQEFDSFLDFHLENHYQCNVKAFCRFLVISLRKYEKLLSEHQRLTVQEWIDDKLNPKQELLNTFRQKFPRKPGDGYTDLNVDKIAIFIHYLRIGRFILKEEYLNNKDAGEAFSILTGYSNVHLRQKLGEAEIKQLLTRKNLDELHNLILRLLKYIKEDLTGRKSTETH